MLLCLGIPVFIGFAIVAYWYQRPIAKKLQQYPNVVFSLPTEKPMIALTVDDGPDQTVIPQMLDVLHTIA